MRERRSRLISWYRPLASIYGIRLAILLISTQVRQGNDAIDATLQAGVNILTLKESGMLSTRSSKNCLKHKLLYLLASLSLALNISASYAKNHAISDIEQQAIHYIQNETLFKDFEDFEVHISALDKRLKLKQCTNPLNFRPKQTSSQYKFRLVVSCETPSPWKTHVSAKVEVYDHVVVLRARQFKGDELNADKLELRRLNIAQFNQGYFKDVDALNGYTMKTSLGRAMPVSPSQVNKPWLIRKDQAVTLSAQSPVLHIRMSGRALMNGREGDWIRAKNLNSGKIIEGKVSQSGELEVSF